MTPKPMTPKPTTPEPTILGEAIQTVCRQLADIHDSMPRCGRCENFLAVVTQVHGDLDGVATPDAVDARKQLAAWLADSAGRIKTTNHCEVCVPVGPYERFSAALASARGDAGDPA
jgi:hypothetical protein